MNAETRTKLHFSRFEFKYMLDRELREQVESELGNFVELDPYVLRRDDHLYFVRSLYFDDAAGTAYQAKIDGLHTRAKFRLRTYAATREERAPWFLEVKGRYNNLVFKHRTPLRGEPDPDARGDELCRMTLALAEPGAVRNQFEFELFRRRIRPIVLVNYLRRPYISRFDPDFRLTFDHDIQACASATMFPRGAVMRAVLPGRTVMEVKFRHHVPSWFHSIIQAYELRRRSVSKICASSEALGIEIEL